MIRTGIISFSDARLRVHESQKEYIKTCEDKIRAALEKTVEVEIIAAEEMVYNSELAKTQSQLLSNKNIDAVIFNVSVFAFPNFSQIAARVQNVPILVVGLMNGKMPGLGGVQAASNAIRQVGMKCEKVWGDIDDEKTLKRIMCYLRAARAVTGLKGQVYGMIGGRSIGIASGSVNPDFWMRDFGVDVDHVDGSEIIRRAALIDDEKVEAGLKWLEKNLRSIQYDNDKLTVDSLKTQIRHYIATKEIAEDLKFDFLGVKCHYDMSEYYVTQCLSAALFNDPYDWDGPKEPVVYSCEADSDAALTMQIMKLISNKPVIFADFRHYDEKDGVFAFCNCGSMSTWYAGRSNDPKENLKRCTLCPIIPKYGGKGCHVQYIASEGEMTFGRLFRVLDKYKFIMFKGRYKDLPAEKLKETCEVWPHGYATVESDPFDLIERYDSNHVHAVAGDYIEELKKFCELKNIEYEVIE
ncbi:MAG: L-fucose/L-arabinose isomerase family protein [Acetivibrionales bacterium]